ncbi:hypothetical protein BJX63DRAFT_416668 [Aspergillus granulosus]|uniref:Uncharacterized protein n=1 Tax=Aspergillus granulosus TaxID=176169 RepID=A0ABR4GRQ2_9EURO
MAANSQRSGGHRRGGGRVEINIANNAELRANAQHILTMIRASRPKNTVLAYEPKQQEFKVRYLLTPLFI